MIELELTAEAEEFGRGIKREQDEAGIQDRFQYAGRDKRWTGFAVEYVLDAYFTERDLPHIWNGGMDRKPDFEFGSHPPGIGVASKANSGPGPRDDFQFVIPREQGFRLADFALFSIFSVSTRRVWVAGMIHSTLFRGVAELGRKGEPGFVPGRPLVADCWIVRLGDLDKPDLFFDMMEVVDAA